MNFLFVHQNFPGQFRHVAPALAASSAHRVVAIGEEANIRNRPSLHPAITVLGYPSPPPPTPSTHHYIRDHERAIRRGQNLARLCQTLLGQGFRPDVVVVHPGWGEGLFLRDLFPAARHIHYCEFFYRGRGSDVGFDPEYPAGLDDLLRVRVKNGTQLISLESADAGLSPTRWQADQYPTLWRERIRVIHDGIDTEVVAPRGDTALQVDGLTLRPGDEVITYVARNLEPYRGFHIFMRALPEILARRPRAHVLIVGGDDVSYGRAAPGGKTYRQLLLEQVGGELDAQRVHWLGKVPYSRFLDILRVSAVHVYLTYPFVLSWSLLEALSTGCLVVGSATAPVQEVISDGENGLLVDFFDRQALADKVVAVLQDPARFAPMRRRARKSVVERYDLKRICLPQTLRLLTEAQ